MDTSYIASIFEALGLGVFIFYLFHGLKHKIAGLEGIVTAQNQTLEVMEKRIVETEKIGDIYRNLMSDLPKDLDNYKTILSKTKDETILELKNQQEITQRKLDDAQNSIEKSKENPETIKHHLSILKNLLSKEDYDIARICEYGDKAIEYSVPLIVSSKTLVEFLTALGLEVEATEDTEITKEIFGKKGARSTPKGAHLENATSTSSMGGGWYMIANNEFYVNQIKLEELQNEFNSIKSNV